MDAEYCAPWGREAHPVGLPNGPHRSASRLQVNLDDTVTRSCAHAAFGDHADSWSSGYFSLSRHTSRFPGVFTYLSSLPLGYGSLFSEVSIFPHSSERGRSSEVCVRPRTMRVVSTSLRGGRSPRPLETACNWIMTMPLIYSSSQSGVGPYKALASRQTVSLKLQNVNIFEIGKFCL